MDFYSLWFPSLVHGVDVGGVLQQQGHDGGVVAPHTHQQGGPGVHTAGVNLGHRLNMELDLQKIFGLHVMWCVHSCSHWLRPRKNPHLGSYTRDAIGQLR